ncbi:MAG: phage integrase SAM-like domain-containing protein, partial [Rhodospirillales bacterium]|nr:phage integrase SAM-like domain-containing protein [Rhodospirillales bacterium]
MESIRGYPDKLVIFKIPESRFWQVRYYDGKPIKRSTKTEDKQKAIQAAKDFFDTLLLNKKLGKTSNPKKTSFITCADAVIAESAQQLQRKERNAIYVRTEKNIINKYIKEFLGAYDLVDIGYTILDQFKTFLYSKNLSKGTIKIHFVAVKKIFSYGQRTNAIKSAPLFPALETEDNPRGYFTIEEFDKLCATANELIGKISKIKKKIEKNGEQTDKKLRNVEITDEIGLLIQFMVHTFIRPTDIKNMKHKHVEIRTNEAGEEYLWMPLPKSKDHDGPIISMPKAAKIYRQLRQLCLDRLEDTTASIAEEYVFMPEHENRTYAYTKLTRQFDVILDTANLKVSDDGADRTLYSLRHTSFMHRLQLGGEVNPLILARNARTSVEMLERFYLSKIENEKHRDELHAKKP